MQGSPENQVPSALGDHDMNVMSGNTLAPIVIPKGKCMDARCDSLLFPLACESCVKNRDTEQAAAEYTTFSSFVASRHNKIFAPPLRSTLITHVSTPLFPRFLHAAPLRSKQR